MPKARITVPEAHTAIVLTDGTADTLRGLANQARRRNQRTGDISMSSFWAEIELACIDAKDQRNG